MTRKEQLMTRAAAGGIMKIDSTDREYQDGVLDEVEINADGSYTLKHDGWSLWCAAVEGLPAPKAGETLRMYGRGIGHTVRGIVIGGRVYRYKTAAQEAADHRAWVDNLHAEREREMEAQRDRIAARLEALPGVFRERIEKFRRDGGHEFQRDYEPYELFCCEQAVEIADALKTTEAIRRFHDLPWKEQKALVPALVDGHSGNTFGMACALARLYLDSPEFVTKAHGALTPLVGCDAYGCKHDSSLPASSPERSPSPESTR